MSEQAKIEGSWVLKAIDRAKRQIKGYFTTSHEDREGEVFTPDMFEATISPGGDYYNNPVLLYHHDPNEVIGHADVATLRVDPIGVYGEFNVTSENRWAQIERGDLRGFSWYGLVDWVNRIVDLVEVTVTPVPVNPKALLAIKRKALELGLASDEDFPDDAKDPAPAGDGDENDMPLSKEDLEAIGAAAGAAAAAVLAPQLTAIQEAQKALQTQAPPATPPAPAATPEPITPPAPAPAAPPAEPVSKGLVLDEEGVSKLIKGVVDEIATKHPAMKGIVPEPAAPGHGTPEEKEAKTKALIGRVKETKYEGSGVELEWGDHLRDGLALEMTGRLYDEIGDNEEIPER